MPPPAQDWGVGRKDVAHELRTQLGHVGRWMEAAADTDEDKDTDNDTDKDKDAPGDQT